jgi:hypothetical protein
MMSNWVLDPEYPWFEEIDFVDEKYLNKYEKEQGIKLNFSYILQFWKEMNSIPKKGNWDIRVDKRESKWWTATYGSKFSKYVTYFLYFRKITCIHVGT